MNHNLPIKIDLPEHFLEEEVRCGYVVTEKQKKIWAIELDLLVEFMRVCDKYHLQWFVGYGTLLGAVRHQGFIPWDNDIDVAITRESFHKLCEVAPSEFKEPYFFRTPITEEGRYFAEYAKLSNNLTTGATHWEYEQGLHCGIYIDIFVLDKIPTQDTAVERLMRPYKLYEKMGEKFVNKRGRHYIGYKKVTHAFWYLIWCVCFRRCKGDTLFKLTDKNYSATWHKGYHRWGALEQNLGMSMTFDDIYWKTTLNVPFEFLTVPIPDGYDWILTDHYGDYMELPAVDNRINHEDNEMSPDTPYYEYFSELMRVESTK
jgi:lipopolysaccharide cholinephosphotransferase